MKNCPLAVLWLFLSLLAAQAGSSSSFEGTWTAPSLSRPDTPIVFALLSNGQATEELGSYRGGGKWQVENGAAKISWESGWVSVLHAKDDGTFEIQTWKTGSPFAGPPDDVQLAQRAD